MCFVSGDALFRLSYDLLAGLNDDDTIFALQASFLDLSALVGQLNMWTHNWIVTRADVTPFLHSPD